MKVGIFGGTFNPPHIGHVQAANDAARQLGLDLLLVIPSGVPPHKKLSAETPAAGIRLKMTENAFGCLENAIVMDIEAKKTEPCYTIDTIVEIKHMYPDDELFLLMGTDMFLSLETWKSFKELLKIVTPAVFSRDENDVLIINEYSERLLKAYGTGVKTISNAVISISSSEIRKLLPQRGAVGYITDTNYSYIVSSRLYNVRPDWDWLRNKAYSMLNPNRVPHVAACETAAVELAARWNVNADDAREAAILHDITKKYDVNAHVKALSGNGVKAWEMTREEEKLLHAISGAVLAKSIFGASDEVVQAIRWHTTGKPDMTMLSKVLYLADYIEATRDFPGVKELRELSFEDIDKAMIMGLEMTVCDVESRGIKPDKATLEAIGFLRGR